MYSKMPTEKYLGGLGGQLRGGSIISVRIFFSVECDSMENTVRQSDQNKADSGYIDADDNTRGSSAHSFSSVTYSVFLCATCLLFSIISR